MSFFESAGSGAGYLADLWTGLLGGDGAEASASTEAATTDAAAAPAPAVASPATDSGGNRLAKATGLTPYLEMLGIVDKPTPEDRMATPSELEDLRQGRLATPGDKTKYRQKVTGLSERKGFEKKTNPDGSSGGYQLPSTQNWKARGVSGGNRKSDIEARDKGVKVGAPELFQPDLSQIAKKVKTKGHKADENGWGYFHDSASGEYYSGDDKKFNALSGKVQVDPTGTGGTEVANFAKYQRGVIEKGGVRAVGISPNKRHTANAELGIMASGGYDGALGLNSKDGLFARAGIGAKAGAYGEAGAQTKTASLKLGGQEYDAGLGVKAEGFAGAKAGASAQIGFSPEFKGAKGSIGAFAGAEGTVNVGARAM